MTENSIQINMQGADILSMTEGELERFVTEELSEPRFRASQLYGWMQKGAPVSEMKNLPASFKEKLQNKALYRLPKIVQKLESKLDGTIKYLMEMVDGECVESVFMVY